MPPHYRPASLGRAAWLVISPTFFRVRYAEVDPPAALCNSRYLEYADLLVTEWFRELSIGVMGTEAIEFHVARALAEFRKPIVVDELNEGRLMCTRLGNASITTAITLHGTRTGAGKVIALADDLRAEIELVQVHVDLDSGKAQPDAVRAKLKKAYFDG